jgi:aldose 1-epimerase
MKFVTVLLTAGALATATVSCNNEEKKTEENKIFTDMTHAGITKTEWGTVDGQAVQLYALTNEKGSVVKITNYGGIITSFVTKDKNGGISSVVVGFDSIRQYLEKPPYFGATIGRYGNRIGAAQFKIEGKTYQLAANNGKNHLHGGLKGFDKVIWTADPLTDSLATLTLNYLSKDGEEGYPGNLQVTVKFTLTDNDELAIVYDATTDKPTPVNLTNHSYWNLSGDTKETILSHELQIDANAYTPVDSGLIPTGEIKKVSGTPFDFTSSAVIGSRIDSVPGGYDHNWVLNRLGTALAKVATLKESSSGRILEVSTTEPGMQFYTGNFLDGKFINHTGTPVKLRTALCLETQHFPDSPNKKDFPTTLLEPGQKYHTETIYKISIAH